MAVGPAGGGYGDPKARDPERVRADVFDGLITHETAREAFGVAVTEALEVDAGATARLRG